ncbi:MAG: hypothetical protein LBS76_01355 [Mycoplasmataceae bacterium]|jgi:hypothetical protein|nr:hypothetical protein [Mycoplasmataceae bacterium]
MDLWSQDQWNMEVFYAIYYGLDKMAKEFGHDYWKDFEIWVSQVAHNYDQDQGMYISFDAHVEWGLRKAPAWPPNDETGKPKNDWFKDLYFKVNNQKIECTPNEGTFAFYYNPALSTANSNGAIYSRHRGVKTFSYYNIGSYISVVFYSWTYQNIDLNN